MSSLNPVYTVGWQLAEAYQAHHDVSRKAAAAQAVEALDLVGIPQPDRRAEQYPHEYSGGMRQRAMIAMAIINDPDLIIADEPTTALDVTVQAQILETLLRVAGRDRRGHHDDHPRPRGGGRHRGQGAGDVRRHDRRVRAGRGHLRASRGCPTRSGCSARCRTRSCWASRSRPIHGAPPSLLHPPPGCSFGPRCPLVEPECRDAEPELVPAPGRAAHRALPALARGHRAGAAAADVPAPRDAPPRRRGRPAPGAPDARPERPMMRTAPRWPEGAARGTRGWRSATAGAAAAGAGSGQALPGARGRDHPAHRSGRCRPSPGCRSTSRRGRRSGWSASPAAASRRWAGPCCSCARPPPARCCSRGAS